jgi:hypothetical protein
VLPQAASFSVASPVSDIPSLIVPICAGTGITVRCRGVAFDVNLLASKYAAILAEVVPYIIDLLLQLR